jgi:RAB protein geranylgeranyltransferase component A
MECRWGQVVGRLARRLGTGELSEMGLRSSEITAGQIIVLKAITKIAEGTKEYLVERFGEIAIVKIVFNH